MMHLNNNLFVVLHGVIEDVIPPPTLTFTTRESAQEFADGMSGKVQVKTLAEYLTMVANAVGRQSYTVIRNAMPKRVHFWRNIVAIVRRRLAKSWRKCGCFWSGRNGCQCDHWTSHETLIQ